MSAREAFLVISDKTAALIAAEPPGYGQTEHCLPTQDAMTDLDIVRYEGERHPAMAAIRELRALCWAGSYALEGSLDDQLDARAAHWAIFAGDELVAAARLTLHTTLADVPDNHLYVETDAEKLSYPLGYLSRLVVHPQMRKRGLARRLDELRIEAARSQGCVSLGLNWNPLSGLSRRAQIFAFGFASRDGERPRADGKLGSSYVYFLDLSTTAQD